MQKRDSSPRSKAKTSAKESQDAIHPDHAADLPRLKRIKGQVEGVEKMILEKRYCPDIIVQIRAVRAALQALEGSVLKTHLRHCVKDAIEAKTTFNTDEKIQEIIELLAR